MRALTTSLVLLSVACGNATPGEVIFDVDTGSRVDAGARRDAVVPPMDVGFFSIDVPPLDRPVRDVQPNPDAFFANNPPPRYCGPDGGDGGPSPTVPGGTPECPDDLLREGCPCFTMGETRPCWPGLRANRGRGICQDGMTTCRPYDEISGRWGPCEGYVLPDPAARLGPRACQCFSEGRWQIDNLSPCFVQQGPNIFAVSTYLDARGQAQCPTLAPGAMPAPQPGTVFSTNHLTVDCTGQFELCFTIRAGDVANPRATDCVLTRTCTSAWYGTAGARQTLPPLPAWTAMDSTCVRRFYDNGGYGEMSVVGLSSECQRIDDGTMQPYVFVRAGYCPLRCNMTPTAPECQACRNGGDGNF